MLGCHYIYEAATDAALGWLVVACQCAARYLVRALVPVGVLVTLPAQSQDAGVPAPTVHAFHMAQLGGTNAITSVDLKSLPETIGIEHEDRKGRFGRMASIAGVRSPEVDEMQLGADQVPGFGYPVPVLRVRFEERAFFDFDKDNVRADSERLLDVVAENMKRDVPDVQLTILGHTDAIGTDAYNVDLSRRRAASVMQALILRGVNAGQLSTVAVGKTQPVAPNSSDEGRARNRRVEFMISASELANLALVSRRRITLEYLAVTNSSRDPPSREPARLAVLRPVPRDSTKGRVGPLQLAQTGTIEGKRPVPQAEIARLAPTADIKALPLKEFRQAELNREFEL